MEEIWTETEKEIWMVAVEKKSLFVEIMISDFFL